MNTRKIDIDKVRCSMSRQLANAQASLSVNWNPIFAVAEPLASFSIKSGTFSMACSSMSGIILNLSAINIICRSSDGFADCVPCKRRRFLTRERTLTSTGLAGIPTATIVLGATSLARRKITSREYLCHSPVEPCMINSACESALNTSSDDGSVESKATRDLLYHTHSELGV